MSNEVKTKKCKSCGAEVVKLAKVCSECGAKLKMGWFKKILIGFGVLIVLVWMLPDGETAPSTPTTATAPEKTPEQIAQEKTDAELKIKQEAEAKATAEAKEKADAETKVAKEKAEAEAKKIPGTIGLKPSEFRDRWNASASSLNMPELKISTINVEKGEVQDTFKLTFNSSHGLLGTANKADGSIRDVMVIAGGKELANPKIAANVILSWGLLIQTTNQNLSATERGNVLREVGAMGDNASFKNVDKSATRGQIKYHLQSSDALGVWFGAGDINDGK